ncbi:MAG: PIN domain-containing protein [Verrucomicrobia bacterium]|nr:PIN domain-containing protein [Verrucomicrobiota bacterium]
MASKRVFVDTSGLVALLNEDDSLHPAAISLWRELARIGSKVILTDWVIAETGNGLARTKARSAFVETVRRLTASTDGLVVSVGPDFLSKALQLYSERPDKNWGLVDCASFVVMSQEGIFDAFTNDRHFEQAGFICLLPAAAV